jgi:hypothetical protein
MERLYTVVRSDLEFGLRAAQSTHAVCEFQDRYPELYREWHAKYKTLVHLEYEDIWSLAKAANEAGIPCALNFEPDLGGKLTSASFGATAKKLLRHLPLLGAVEQAA